MSREVLLGWGGGEEGIVPWKDIVEDCYEWSLLRVLVCDSMGVWCLREHVHYGMSNEIKEERGMNVEFYHCILLFVMLIVFCVGFGSWTLEKPEPYMVILFSTVIMLSLMLSFCVKAVKAVFLHKAKSVKSSAWFFLGGVGMYGIVLYLMSLLS